MANVCKETNNLKAIFDKARNMKIKGHAKEYYLKINKTIKNPNLIKNFNLSVTVNKNFDFRDNLI